MKSPPKAIAALEGQRTRAVPKDKLQALRDQAEIYRNLVAEKTDLAERLTDTNKALNELEFKTLPDMMDELGIPRIDIEAEGNHPAIKIEAKPYYRANIAASWPEDKRQEAFGWLTDHGSGDLIKTSVTTAFPREDRDKAIEFARDLESKGLLPVVKEAVASQTLTAWLKEQVEKHSSTPPLDVFGATVGRRAIIKEL